MKHTRTRRASAELERQARSGSGRCKEWAPAQPGYPADCNASVARIEGDPCRPTEGGAFFGIRSADRGAALRGLVFWRLNRVFMRSTRTSRKVQAILESIPKSNPTTMLSENPICQVEGNVERVPLSESWPTPQNEGVAARPSQQSVSSPHG